MNLGVSSRSQLVDGSVLLRPRHGGKDMVKAELPLVVLIRRLARV